MDTKARRPVFGSELKLMIILIHLNIDDLHELLLLQIRDLHNSRHRLPLGWLLQDRRNPALVLWRNELAIVEFPADGLPLLFSAADHINNNNFCGVIFADPQVPRVAGANNQILAFWPDELLNVLDPNCGAFFVCVLEHLHWGQLEDAEHAVAALRDVFCRRNSSGRCPRRQSALPRKRGSSPLRPRSRLWSYASWVRQLACRWSWSLTSHRVRTPRCERLRDRRNSAAGSCCRRTAGNPKVCYNM